MQAMQMAAPLQGAMNVAAGAQPAMAAALQKIQPLTSSRVQQQRRLLEAVSCFEQQNMYIVYAGEGNENQLFWVQENSSCIQRNCLPPDCAPWTLSFHNLQQQVEIGTTGKHNPEFLKIERPCSFTCCCFNRPEASITEVPSGRVIGTLRDPWACCNFTYEIRDSTGAERMKTNTCCLQVGTCCPCPGNKITYPVLDSQDSHEAATVQKTWMCGDCCPLCSKEWSNITVHYGEASNLDYKLLLLALGNFIQIRQFDSRNS